MAWKPSTWAKRVRLVCIASIATAIAAVAIPATMTSPAEAKTPGKTYCFVGKCHRVKTIEETQALVGVEDDITASHYDDCSKDRYNPCGLTSSGERFHPDRPDNTASPIYPDGTQLLVWSPKNQRALVVRVNNAGPYWGNRTLDLSRAAAEKLGFEGEGVAKLKVKVIKAPEVAETQYKKNREYAPVPGDIGQYASLSDAQLGMAVVLAFKATTGSPFAPVTTANAFSGQSVGAGNMLVAEAPQAIGRVTTVAYSPASTSIAFSGFDTQSHASQAQSRALGHAINQSRWDEDRVIDGPVKLSAITETSSITAPAPKKVEAAKQVAKAKLAAAAYDDDAKPAKKKSAKGDKAEKSDKSEKSGKSVKTASKSRKSRRDRDVASNDERRSRGYREEREYRPRVAYQTEGYYSGGHSESSRSAGQTMSDNFRPL